MRTALVLLTLLAALTPLAAANPLPITVSHCTPYYAFLDPMPRECASVYFGNINDFCVSVGPASKCVHFIGPYMVLP